MTFKQIENKDRYLFENYPFEKIPKLTDKKHCLHCDKTIIVGDYKVEIDEFYEEYIVCPNAPECDGTVMDWISLK
jgi:hypothetical protein